jgi:hypothetical protein
MQVPHWWWLLQVVILAVQLIASSCASSSLVIAATASTVAALAVHFSHAMLQQQLNSNTIYFSTLLPACDTASFSADACIGRYGLSTPACFVQCYQDASSCCLACCPADSLKRSNKPVVLVRDTNAWCPFCERVSGHSLLLLLGEECMGARAAGFQHLLAANATVFADVQCETLAALMQQVDCSGG